MDGWTYGRTGRYSSHRNSPSMSTWSQYKDCCKTLCSETLGSKIFSHHRNNDLRSIWDGNRKCSSYQRAKKVPCDTKGEVLRICIALKSARVGLALSMKRPPPSPMGILTGLGLSDTQKYKGPETGSRNHCMVAHVMLWVPSSRHTWRLNSRERRGNARIRTCFCQLLYSFTSSEVFGGYEMNFQHLIVFVGKRRLGESPQSPAGEVS